MKQATYILTDENGIHARPAGVITQMAEGEDEENAVAGLLAELRRIGL